MKALIVANDAEERDILGYALQRVGLGIVPSSDVTRIDDLLPQTAVDLLIVATTNEALALSKLEMIRQLTQAPMILISDPLTENQTCDLLDIGVDMLLRRPFSVRVFSRYAQMLLRRAGSVPATVLSRVRGGGLVLEPAKRSVLVGETAVQLTPLEFRLLYVLMTHQGQVIPVETIVERVWGYSGGGNRELVRGLISRLRRKVEPKESQQHLIENVPGIGYRFSGDS